MHIGHLNWLFFFPALIFVPALGFALDLPENDYPTLARADYVFGCMAVNGQSRESLRRCSCSIDKIAEMLSFKNYEAAEKILSAMRKGDDRMQESRPRQVQEKVRRLRLAQVEAELLCF